MNTNITSSSRISFPSSSSPREVEEARDLRENYTEITFTLKSKEVVVCREHGTFYPSTIARELSAALESDRTGFVCFHESLDRDSGSLCILASEIYKFQVTTRSKAEHLASLGTK